METDPTARLSQSPPVPPDANALRWLEAFAACVRERRLDAGRELFADRTCAFGTRAEVVNHLDALIAQQWRPTWNSTREFHFLEDTLSAIPSADGSLVCILALWESLGEHPAGGCYPRRGRCTVLLQRAPGATTRYRAVHTHFSLTPVATATPDPSR